MAGRVINSPAKIYIAPGGTVASPLTADTIAAAWTLPVPDGEAQSSVSVNISTVVRDIVDSRFPQPGGGYVTGQTGSVTVTASAVAAEILAVAFGFLSITEVAATGTTPGTKKVDLTKELGKEEERAIMVRTMLTPYYDETPKGTNKDIYVGGMIYGARARMTPSASLVFGREGNVSINLTFIPLRQSHAEEFLSVTWRSAPSTS